MPAAASRGQRQRVLRQPPVRWRPPPVPKLLLAALASTGVLLCRRGPGPTAVAAASACRGASARRLWTPTLRVSRQLAIRAAAATAAPQADLGSCRLDAAGTDAKAAWQHIEALRQRLRRVPDVPMWRGRPAIEDVNLLWWFLRDRRLDVAESAEKLLHCLRWRRSFRVDRLGPELFSKELRTRKAYLHKHTDIVGRPVLVAIAQRHSILERRLEDSCRMCAWFMERALDKLDLVDPPPLGCGDATRDTTAVLVAGDASSAEAPVEQALGVFDLRGFSPLQADLEFAKFLVEALHEYYPGRFGRVLFVDAPEVFSSFWDNVRPLLRKYASLIEFVSAEEVRRCYFAPGCEPPELVRR